MIRVACILMVFASAAMADPAFDALLARAESGEVNAQLRVGSIYRDGKEVERDYEAAVRWYRKAVEAGSIDAFDHLGFMYLRGWGVRVDFPEARRLFEKAADGGSHQALFNLGRVYAEGLGVAVDREKAAQFWQRSATAGNRNAPLALALLEWHREGGGDPKIVQSRLNDAVSQSNPTAAAWMAYIGVWTGVVSSHSPQARHQLTQADRENSADDPERTTLAQWVDLRKREPVPGRFVFIDLPHRTQGHNMCAPTAAAIALSMGDRPGDPYAIKAKCRNSPTGTGTDWTELVASIRTFGRDAEIVTFEHNDAGFEAATAALKAELDAGRPALVDVIEPSREAKSAHTVVAVGYDKDAGTWILHDPAEGPPGLWIVTDERLKEVWHSRWWTRTSTGYARPMITIRR